MLHGKVVDVKTAPEYVVGDFRLPLDVEAAKVSGLHAAIAVDMRRLPAGLVLQGVQALGLDYDSYIALEYAWFCVFRDVELALAEALFPDKVEYRVWLQAEWMATYCKLLQAARDGLSARAIPVGGGRWMVSLPERVAARRDEARHETQPAKVAQARHETQPAKAVKVVKETLKRALPTPVKGEVKFTPTSLTGRLWEVVKDGKHHVIADLVRELHADHATVIGRLRNIKWQVRRHGYGDASLSAEAVRVIAGKK
ncbi:MAG: hypothetical protein KGL39_41070 [Patescibacteria group bacterium]|nr:hypothetical protein [Patescibacteria group bacterium]